MSSKLTPEERGRNLEAFAKAAELEEEAERLGSMTHAEVAASIAGSGHDQEAARAMGRRAAEAFAKAKAKPAAEPDAKPLAKVIPLAPRRPSRLVFSFAAVAAAAALLGFEGSAMVAWLESSGGTTVAGGRDVGPHFQEARDLTSAAFKDCYEKRFAECLKKLDRAAVLWPDNDGDPDVKRVRAKAVAALAAQAGGLDGGTE